MKHREDGHGRGESLVKENVEDMMSSPLTSTLQCSSDEDESIELSSSEEGGRRTKRERGRLGGREMNKQGRREEGGKKKRRRRRKTSTRMTAEIGLSTLAWSIHHMELRRRHICHDFSRSLFVSVNLCFRGNTLDLVVSYI